MLKPEPEMIAAQGLLFEKIASLIGQITSLQRDRKTAAQEINQLRLARNDAALRFSEHHLGGAIVNMTLQVIHTDKRLVPTKHAPEAFVEAVASVPGLRLDHVRLIQKDRRTVGLITMPYHHGEDFISEGESDQASWRSYDNLSWWYPGQTRLTAVYQRFALDRSNAIEG